MVIESRGDGSDPEEKLFLKDKEVISDPQKQYEIAREMHLANHGGINKTTASIAEKYHWGRIKDTATLAIKNCAQCFDPVKNSATAMGQNLPGIDTEHNSEDTSIVPPEIHNQQVISQSPALSSDKTQEPLAIHSKMQDGPQLNVADSMDTSQYQVQVPVDPTLLSWSDYRDGPATEEDLLFPPR